MRLLTQGSANNSKANDMNTANETDKSRVDRDKKTRSFDGLCNFTPSSRSSTRQHNSPGQFAATSLNDMRAAGRRAAAALCSL